MLRLNSVSYFARTVIIVATIGLVLQACGQAKHNITVPQAATPTDASAKTSTSGSSIAVQTSSPNTPASSEVDTTIGGEKVTIKLESATVTASSTTAGQPPTAVTPNVKLNINGEEITIPSMTNQAPAADPTSSSKQSVATASVDVQKIDFTITAQGNFDFGNPQNYYLILSLTRKGQETAAGGSQGVAIVIGVNPSLGTALPAMVLDPAQDHPMTSDEITTFINFISPLKGIAPAVLMSADDDSSVLTPASRLNFILGSQQLEVKVDSAKVSAPDNNNQVSSTVVLDINGQKFTLPNTNDLKAGTDSTPAAISADQGSTSPYQLIVDGNIDASNPSSYYMTIEIEQTGAASSDASSTTAAVQNIGVAFDSSNPQNIILELDKAPNGSGTPSLLAQLKTDLKKVEAAVSAAVNAAASTSPTAPAAATPSTSSAAPAAPASSAAPATTPAVVPDSQTAPAAPVTPVAANSAAPKTVAPALPTVNPTPSTTQVPAAPAAAPIAQVTVVPSTSVPSTSSLPAPAVSAPAVSVTSAAVNSNPPIAANTAIPPRDNGLSPTTTSWDNSTASVSGDSSGSVSADSTSSQAQSSTTTPTATPKPSFWKSPMKWFKYEFSSSSTTSAPAATPQAQVPRIYGH